MSMSLQEASLLLASPHLLLKLKGKHKTHTMLLSSDYERNEWVETIKGLKSKGKRLGKLYITFILFCKFLKKNLK